MAYSTGRGGAGNIHSNKNKTSENNVLTPQNQQHFPHNNQMMMVVHHFKK